MTIYLPVLERYSLNGSLLFYHAVPSDDMGLNCSQYLFMYLPPQLYWIIFIGNSYLLYMSYVEAHIWLASLWSTGGKEKESTQRVEPIKFKMALSCYVFLIVKCIIFYPITRGGSDQLNSRAKLSRFSKVKEKSMQGFILGIHVILNKCFREKYFGFLFVCFFNRV